MVKFRGVDIKTGKRDTKILKDDGVVYLLRPPKYIKTGFARILRRFFKRLSKRTGKKWISIYWDIFEFNIVKPYINFENRLIWYITRPMLFVYSYVLLVYDFLLEQQQKLQPKIEELRIWWEDKKYFYGLKAYYIDYRTTEDWNIHMMRRERRGVFAYNKKADYIAPFKIFLIYNYLWITISEIEGELLARSELFFYEWFYRLEFRLTLRFLKLIRTLPHFFNAPIFSEYQYMIVIETKAIQTFLKSKVLQKSRDSIALYVFKGYLYFTINFILNFVRLRFNLFYYFCLDYFVDVLLKVNVNPILVRKFLLDPKISLLIYYNNTKFKNYYTNLVNIKNMIYGSIKLVLKSKNDLLLVGVQFLEKLYKSDRFSLVRYLKYYRIIALGKNYFSNIFYKLFLVFFFVTNFYVFIYLHPNFYTTKPYVSGGMYTSYISHYYFNIIINFMKDLSFSLPIADFSSEFLAFILLCYIWVKSVIYFNPIIALLFLWFGFFLILTYFLPADKNPFLNSNYNKFEAEIIEELQKFIDLETANKINYFKTIFRQNNKLSNITKNAFINDLVFEFNNDAKASYELLWFETSADNSESLMHVSPLLYLNDYYSFAVMPSMMEDDYPVAIGFDDEEMEYNVHWVLAEAQVAPESGYNADIEADLTAENVFEEDNTYDFPIEPATWEFDDEIDEDPIDLEEFMHVYQMMYSAPDYLLHEIYWDVYYQQSMDEAEIFEDESFLPRVLLEMYSPIKYRDLFGDPNCDDPKEEEKYFEIVKVFTRETRIPYDMIWLDTGAFPGEANGGDERAELESIEHADTEMLYDAAWNLIHSNLNTFYMERIPYGKRNLDLIQRNNYTSYEIDYFLIELRNIPKLTREEIFELRLDGVLIDDAWEDNGMVLMNEDEDFDDFNAFVDFVSAEHYDNAWAYNSAIIDGGYHFIEMDDEDDLQSDYPSIAVSEWARNELKHLEVVNYLMFEDWMKAVPMMLKPVDSDIAETSNFNFNKSRKYMALSSKVAPTLDFDLNYSEFQDNVLNTAYDSEDYDLLDLYMDKVYTTQEIFNFDPEENDITWHDIYEVFLGYMPNVFGNDLEKFNPQKSISIKTYDETDSYIMFGMDLENEFYNISVYSYTVVTTFLITVYYNIIKLKFTYIPNMNFVVRLKEPGFAYQGEQFWDKWVRKWKKGSKKLRKRDGTFEWKKEHLINRDEEHIKIVVTKKLFPGFGYEKLFAHSIFFTTLFLIILELIIHFHVLKWDYLEAKKYINNGGQTLLYKFSKKKIELNNSKIYLFSPEENANYATSSYLKNKNLLRKWNYDIDEDGRVITEIPNFYTFDSDIKRYSFNNLFPLAPDIVEFHSLAGFVGDFPSPDTALLEGFLRDPLAGLGLFRQHHKYYEGEMYNLMVLQMGPYEDYEPSDEVMEDVEDAWRINIKSYGVNGDGGDAIDIYTKYHSFINWASIVWNDTDIMLWRRLTAQGRYFSNYEHVGNKMNQTYDTEYDIWVFVAGFNHERKKLAGIRYHNENRAKFKYGDLKITSAPYLLRRLITRRFLPTFFKDKFKKETLRSILSKKRKILRSKRLLKKKCLR